MYIRKQTPTIGEIASALAGAGEVSSQARESTSVAAALRSLHEAGRWGAALTPPSGVRELDALDRKAPDVPFPITPAPTRPHRRALSRRPPRHKFAELIGLAQRIEAAHANAYPLAPKGLADALEASYESLLDRMTKEEAVCVTSLDPRDRISRLELLGFRSRSYRHRLDHQGEREAPRHRGL